MNEPLDIIIVTQEDVLTNLTAHNPIKMHNIDKLKNIIRLVWSTEAFWKKSHGLNQPKVIS